MMVVFVFFIKLNVGILCFFFAQGKIFLQVVASSFFFLSATDALNFKTLRQHSDGNPPNHGKETKSAGGRLAEGSQK
jgi:hypothetical protein